MGDFCKSRSKCFYRIHSALLKSFIILEGYPFRDSETALSMSVSLHVQSLLNDVGVPLIYYDYH